MGTISSAFLYKALGSKKITGSFLLIEANNKPLAWIQWLGQTTFIFKIYKKNKL